MQPDKDWSPEPPTEPSYYWWHDLPDIGKKIMHVPFVDPQVICATAGQNYYKAKAIGGYWHRERINEPA